MDDDERNERYRRLMQKIDYLMMNGDKRTCSALYAPAGTGKVMRYRNTTDPNEQEEMKGALRRSGLPVELLEKMVDSDICLENGNVLDAPIREIVQFTLVSDSDKVGFILILDDTEMCRFSTERVTCDVPEGVYVMKIVTDDGKRKVIQQSMAIIDVSVCGRKLGIKVKKTLFGYKIEPMG